MNQASKSKLFDFHLLTNQYCPLKTLKSTSYCKTVLAQAFDSKKKFVIKTYPKSNPQKEQVFLHEISTLSSIQNQFVVPISQFGTEENNFYLITPFISSENLNDFILQKENTPIQILSLFEKILFGLREIHKRGIIHQDLKPEHILIVKKEKTFSPVLIDFSLSLQISEKSSTQPKAGNLLYMAPEQLELTQHPTSIQSDLYAFGLLFYEALEKKNLFYPKDLKALYEQKLSIPSILFQNIPEQTHEFFRSFLRNLIHPDPHSRYKNANYALFDLKKILYWFHNKKSSFPKLKKRSISISLKTIDPSCQDLDPKKLKTSQVFIERNHEWGFLKNSLQKTSSLFWIVAGESGTGKSFLFKKFIHNAQDQNYWTFLASGMPYSMDQPLKVLEPIFYKVIKKCTELPEWILHLQKNLISYQKTLLEIFPPFSIIFPHIPFQKTLGKEEHGRFRVLEAMLAFFKALETCQRKIVIVLDDFQWTDELSQTVLQALSKKISEKYLKHIKFYVGLREKNETNHKTIQLFQKNTPEQTIYLHAFTKSETNQLVTQLLEAPPNQEVLDWIYQHCKGNPFLTQQVVFRLQENRFLKLHQKQWEFEKEFLKNTFIKKSKFFTKNWNFSEITQELSPSLKKLLQIASVFGRTFDLPLLHELSTYDTHSVFKQLQKAIKLHLIYQIKENRYQFIHDKVLESVLETLSVKEKQCYHLKIAQYLKTHAPSEIYLIATHLAQAQAFHEALPWALEAAKKSRSRYALDVAEKFYRIALEGFSETSTTSLSELYQALGETLMLRGSYQEANHFLNLSYKQLKTTEKKVALLALQGELFFKKGDMKASSQVLLKGLKLLGFSSPKNMFSLIVHLSFEIIIQCFHTLFPSLLLHKKDPTTQMGKTDLLKTRLFSRLAYAWWFQKGTLYTLLAHLKELNLAENYPLCKELAQAYSNHSPVMTVLPLPSRAIRYAKKSLKIRMHLQDTLGIGQSLHFYGIAHLAASHLEKAHGLFKTALYYLNQTGDQWEINATTYHLALTNYRMGRLKKSIQISKKLYRRSLEIGDIFASGASLRPWANASGGALPLEILFQELDRESEDQQRNAELFQVNAMRYLREGDPFRAYHEFKRALEIAKKAQLTTKYVACIQVWMLSCLRLAHEKIPIWDVFKRKQILSLFKKHALKARINAWRFPNNKAHFWREYAYYQLLLKHFRKAKKYFLKSIYLSLKQHAFYEHALSLYYYGTIGETLKWPRASLLLKKANLFLYQLKQPQTYFSMKIQEATFSNLKNHEQLQELLRWGTKIAFSFSKKIIFQTLIQACKNLFNTNYIYLFLKKEKNSKPKLIFGSKEIFSETLVQNAYKKGEPLLLKSSTPDSWTKSFIISEAKSVMLIPFEENTDRYCLYIAHAHIFDFFTETDLHLGKFLTSLAQSSLENITKFLKIKSLSHDLSEELDHRKQTERSLEKTIQQKNLLLREIFHRTKNNLQVISSLLYLQMKHFSKNSFFRKTLDEIQNRIHTMALVHESLYRQDTFSRVFFDDYLKKMIQDVLKIHGVPISTKRIKMYLVKDTISIDQAIPAALAIHEIIQNTVKHGFYKNPKFCFQIHFSKFCLLENKKNIIQLEIKNNLYKSSKKTIQLFKNTSKHKKHLQNKAGLLLVKGLIQNQLKGEITFTKNHGMFHMKIQFPETEKLRIFKKRSLSRTYHFRENLKKIKKGE